MPQRHRGPHPDDARLFGHEALGPLRAAAHEVAWLVERGYSIESAVRFVGGHHQLEARARVAVTRSTCAPSVAVDRARRALAPADVRGRPLAIDGFNVVITTEVALGGGVILIGADGAPRDLAGLRGTYRIIDETEPALDAIVATLGSLGVARATFFLDAPVSNSGRLRAAIEERAAARGFDADARLVPDADRALAGLDLVASSDAVVIDAATRWANLTAWTIDAHAPRAWRVPLFP